MPTTNSAKRIAGNTTLLYLRSAISLFLGLFSTRYILSALGAHDFGLYALVGSVTAFLSFINNSMGESTTRFLTYNSNDSSEDRRELNVIFNSGMALQLLIAVSIVILLELPRAAVLSRLNVSKEALDAAGFVYHCMVASSFFTIIGAPYDGCIIANERFSFYTMYSIFESVAKFSIAFLIGFVADDRVQTYGVLMAAISILGFVARWLFCVSKFPEARVRFSALSRRYMKEISGFSIWILVDLLSCMFRFNALDIALNAFVGTLANASFAVAKQVSGSLMGFAASLLSASRPQTIRLVSAGQHEHAIARNLTVSKYGFLLMAVFSIPLYVAMPSVLTIWLKNPPSGAVEFCRLSLLSNMVSVTIIRGLSVLIDASGDIKNYRLSIAISNFGAFPVAWAFLKFGGPPYSVLYGVIASDLAQIAISVSFVSSRFGMKWKNYLYAVPFRLGVVFAITVAAASYAVAVLGSNDYLRLVVATLTTGCVIFPLFWVAIDDGERRALSEFSKRIRASLFQRLGIR